MSPRPQSTERLQRMLALIPWILSHPEVTIDALARRFKASTKEIENDLVFLPLCGLPPYSPDRLMDVWITDDGAVTISMAEYFYRPLKLTPNEGLALLTAGRALLAVPGSDQAGPLATALHKLEKVVGGSVVVEVDPPNYLTDLQQAIAQAEVVELTYHSLSRGETSVRQVDPQRIFHALGAWYLAAFCHQAGGNRLFRVDRIHAIRMTGLPVTKSSSEDDLDSVFHPQPSDERVRLLVEPAALWAIEDLPTESQTLLANGATEIVIAVSSPDFLYRLLLRLGPQVQILEPTAALAALGVIAQRILSNYES